MTQRYVTPNKPAHLFVLSSTGRWKYTETRVVGDVFRPDDLWFGWDTYTNCASLYNLYWDA